MKILAFIIIIFQISILMSSCSPSLNLSKVQKDEFLTDLFQKYPHYFDSIIKNNDQYRVQVIYTRIDRKDDGTPEFTDHYYNLDDDRYFYPASTVKLPVAILALQKLNELQIPGLNKYSTMITGADHSGQSPVNNDSSSADGKPSIAHYIKKILLVSDNDAFNRLYEFLGQEYINSTLHKMGYANVQIIHRLSIPLTEEQNRHANPVRFFDEKDQLLYVKPEEKSGLVYANRNTKMGKGYMKGDSLVNEPFDFSKKNRLLLKELHSILRAVIFPNSVDEKQRFRLSPEDYDFLRKYMSMLPHESNQPYYDSSEYHDTYVKFLLFGAEKGAAEPGIRIFNKPGDAYGFMIDAAYIADFKNNIEFMVSAVIHCNSDQIFNDDRYEYKTVGYPFMKNLGKMLYDYELKRERKNKPDLTSMKLIYTQE